MKYMDFDHLLEMDAGAMDARLRARLKPSELFALAMALAMSGIFLWLFHDGQNVFFDLRNYLSAGEGIFKEYYYAYWLLPVFTVLGRLPFDLTAILWDLTGIACLWIACRVFNSRLAPILIGYQTLYALFYGQITLVLVGGLALAWWSMAHQKWDLAGLGFIIATSKYQIGLVFAFMLWVAAPIPWRQRIRILILPAIIVVLTMLLYPTWIQNTIATFASSPPNDFGSISLWRWIGPWSLLLFIPALFVRSTKKRLILLVIAATLAMPYFQQADLICLFLFLPFWIALIGNLGFLYIWLSWPALQMMAIVPLIPYLWLLGQSIQNWLALSWNKKKSYGLGR
jgi:hypothetical protein